MSPEAAAIVARLHGACAWLGAASLVWTALRRGVRPASGTAAARPRASAWIAPALVTVAGGLGMALEPAYRNLTRQKLFLAAPWAGRLLEGKMHWAVGAVLLAWCGLALSHAAARPWAARPSAGAWLRVAALRAHAAAALLALAACIAGSAAATRLAPP